MDYGVLCGAGIGERRFLEPCGVLYLNGEGSETGYFDLLQHLAGVLWGPGDVGYCGARAAIFGPLYDLVASALDHKQ